jgi:Ran GTPase-activating protein (RanGAP) involved in mRNA processing and transport
METGRTILCPIKGPLPAPNCPPSELAPLLDMLRENRPVTEPRTFPRGTLLPDGRLDLCKQGLGVAGCREVTAALTGNTVVRSLLLGTNGIGDEGADAVAELLSANRTLEVVYLGCNGIGAAGTERLSEAVRANPTVAGLWLKRNPIGVGGLKAVASLIRGETSVRVLDLVNTCPGELALDEIVAALSEEPNLVESLYLGGNALDESAGSRLAALVAENETLRGLFLSVNCLGDAGAIRLAAGLVRNRALSALSLASNGLGPVGVAAVARALCGHPNLTWLDLGYSPSTRVLGCSANRVTGAAVSALADLVTNSPRLTELNLTKTGVEWIELERLADAVERSPGIMSVTYTGPRVARLDELLADRRATRGWKPPPRPDIALIRSVYR